MTEGQSFKAIMLHVYSNSILSGTLAFNFQDEPTFLNLDSRSAMQCEAAFEVNPKFNDVSCEYLEAGTGDVFYNITFLSWPLYPAENNVYFHSGNPSAEEFSCDTTFSSLDVACDITDITNTNIKGLVFAFS